jgi:hypothetical protein
MLEETIGNGKPDTVLVLDRRIKPGDVVKDIADALFRVNKEYLDPRSLMEEVQRTGELRKFVFVWHPNFRYDMYNHTIEIYANGGKSKKQAEDFASRLKHLELGKPFLYILSDNPGINPAVERFYD